MSVPKLNVRTCELDESLDRAGFRHVGAYAALLSLTRVW